jgi:hypothetical protein
MIPAAPAVVMTIFSMQVLYKSKIPIPRILSIPAYQKDLHAY